MSLLKLMPAIYEIHLTGPLAHKLMTIAREQGLVVNIHSGSEISHPLAIGALARRFPDVTVLMDHVEYREWTSDAIEAARDNPNLFLGTTIAAFEPVVVQRAVRELGPERVVHGSNWPNLYSDLAVEAIRRAKPSVAQSIRSPTPSAGGSRSRPCVRPKRPPNTRPPSAHPR
jgi:uncharacterized protein